MDAFLRRALRAIAADRRSGAAALTLRAAAALDAWLRRNRSPGQAELRAIARALLRAQPSMAPLLRLASDVALAAETPRAGEALRRRLAAWRGHLRSAPGAIARHFARWIRRRSPAVVITYSSSSTVAECLRASRRALHSVRCSESRPAGEGLALARALARAGIRVHFSTDAVLTGQICDGRILLLGADAVLRGCFASKAGARALVELARMRRCPVVIAADTSKFWPEPRRGGARWQGTFGPPNELWKRPPKSVEVYNLYFELTFFTPRSRLRFLTEKGWMTPRQVRRELDKIRVSPRLGRLVDWRA